MLRATLVFALLIQPVLALAGRVPAPCAEEAAPPTPCCCAMVCCPADVVACGCAADQPRPTQPATPAKETAGDLIPFTPPAAIALEPGSNAPPFTPATRSAVRHATHNERLARLGTWRT